MNDKKEFNKINNGILVAIIIGITLILGILIVSDIGEMSTAFVTESDSEYILNSSVNQLSIPGDLASITSSSLYALNNSYLSFDGVDDYVNAGNSPSLNITQELTSCLWIKTIDKTSENIQILHKKGNGLNGWDIYSDGNSLIARVNATQVYVALASESLYADGNWHLACLEYNSSGNLTGYFDGNKIKSVVSTSTSIISLVNLNIGRRSVGTAYYFNGFIDEVRIYNRSLSSSEITEIYNSGRYKNLSLPSDGLVLYMPFEETNGTTIYDNSGNNNNGVLIYE